MVFLREGDAAHFEQIIQRILDDATVIEIVGTHSRVLEHYARVLIRRLRGQADIQLEVFLPTGIDNLLDRFNRALADVSVTEAANSQRAGHPSQVLLLKETEGNHSHDGRVLAKLARSFPAANLKLISLRCEPGSPENAEGLQITGARSLRWRVEAPSIDDAKNWLDSIDDAQLKLATRTVLAKIHSSIGEDQPIVASRPRRVTVESLGDDDRVVVLQDDIQVKENSESGATQRRKRIPLIDAAFMVGISLMASATVIAVLYPDHIRALAEFAGVAPKPVILESAKSKDQARSADPSQVASTSVVGRDGLQKLAVDKSAADAPKSETQAQSSPAPAAAVQPSVPTPTAFPAVSATAAAAAGSVAAGERVVPVQPVVAAKPSVTPPQAPQASAVPTVPAGIRPPEAQRQDDAKTPVQAKIKLPEPVKEANSKAGVTKGTARTDEDKKKAPQKARAQERSPVNSEIARVNNTPGNFFFVQHAALDTQEAAERWRADHDAFASARILPTRGKNAGQVIFVVVNGPFRSTEAADTYMKKRAAEAQYWVRSAASLKAVLESTGSARNGVKKDKP